MAKKFKMLQGYIIAWISLMETSQNGTGTGTGIPKTTIYENMYDICDSQPYLAQGGAHCAPPVTYLRITVQILVRARWKDFS